MNEWSHSEWWDGKVLSCGNSNDSDGCCCLVVVSWKRWLLWVNKWEGKWVHVCEWFVGILSRLLLVDGWWLAGWRVVGLFMNDFSGMVKDYWMIDWGIKLKDVYWVRNGFKYQLLYIYIYIYIYIYNQWCEFLRCKVHIAYLIKIIPYRISKLFIY